MWGSIGLVQDRNGSFGCRHLLLSTVSTAAANTKKSLKDQELPLFLQVPAVSTSL